MPDTFRRHKFEVSNLEKKVIFKSLDNLKSYTINTNAKMIPKYDPLLQVDQNIEKITFYFGNHEMVL